MALNAPPVAGKFERAVRDSCETPKPKADEVGCAIDACGHDVDSDRQHPRMLYADSAAPKLTPLREQAA